MTLSRKTTDAPKFRSPQQSLVGRTRALLPLPGDSEFPSPPALPDSLLQLDLALSVFVADLGQITNIILADIGLTAQLLRLGAGELDQLPSRGVAVSEIVLLLGLDKLKSLAARTSPLAGYPALGVGKRFWRHARLTAMIAEELAAQSSQVYPDIAYVAGLLFHLGDLPLVLGWASVSDNFDPSHTGQTIARAWGFPPTLVDVIAADPDLCLPSSRTLLDVVIAADRWASRLEFLASRESADFRSANCLTH